MAFYARSRLHALRWRLFCHHLTVSPGSSCQCCLSRTLGMLSPHNTTAREFPRPSRSTLLDEPSLKLQGKWCYLRRADHLIHQGAHDLLDGLHFSHRPVHTQVFGGWLCAFWNCFAQKVPSFFDTTNNPTHVHQAPARGPWKGGLKNFQANPGHCGWVWRVVEPAEGGQVHLGQGQPCRWHQRGGGGAWSCRHQRCV